MITRDNFTSVVQDTFRGLESELDEKVYNFEYVRVDSQSYGGTWVEGYYNDLPEDYDELVSGGMTSFLLVAEVHDIICNG